MKPRIVAQVDAFSKIAPTGSFRFFMHPDENKKASLEFDTKGLSSLELSPYIDDFSANKDCAGNPKAGVVKVTWYLDGAEQSHLTVDRNYNAVVPVKVAGSSRLKVVVDKGNDVTWCDWFSVGFLNVK